MVIRERFASRVSSIVSLLSILIGLVVCAGAFISATQLSSATAVCREGPFPAGFVPDVPEAVQVTGTFVWLPFGARCTYLDQLKPMSDPVVVEPPWSHSTALAFGLTAVIVGGLIGLRARARDDFTRVTERKGIEGNDVESL